MYPDRSLLPRALFPALGVVPDEDYEVTYSGSHDQSMLGVVAGDYDAAPVASEVVDRMADRRAFPEGCHAQDHRSGQTLCRR